MRVELLGATRGLAFHGSPCSILGTWLADPAKCLRIQLHRRFFGQLWLAAVHDLLDLFLREHEEAVLVDLAISLGSKRRPTCVGAHGGRALS